jgi:serine/threonine-protein kinase HipA
MFHTTEGLRHTPAYDLVAAALYPQFNTLALSINGAENLGIGDLKPKHIIALGHACGLSEQAILMTIADLDKRRASVSKIVQYESKKIGNEALGQKLLDFMERRWNGSFNSIGTLLSKKQ